MHAHVRAAGVTEAQGLCQVRAWRQRQSAVAWAAAAPARGGWACSSRPGVSGEGLGRGCREWYRCGVLRCWRCFLQWQVLVQGSKGCVSLATVVRDRCSDSERTAASAHGCFVHGALADRGLTPCCMGCAQPKFCGEKHLQFPILPTSPACDTFGRCCCPAALQVSCHESQDSSAVHGWATERQALRTCWHACIGQSMHAQCPIRPALPACDTRP